MLCHKITGPGFNDPDALFLKNILKDIFKSNNIVLCQIGANDGISADPIFDYIKENKNIEAHLVEPQKDAFSLLIKNYDDIKLENRVFFYKNALTNVNEEIKLYKNTAINGTDGHSSLLIRDLYIVNGLEVAKYDEFNYEIVQGITLFELNKKINKEIDVLVIDTEGYDVEIIKMFINENIYPKIIYFEKPSISGNIPGQNILLCDSAEKYILNTLNDKYVLNKLEDNWICIKKN